MASAFSVLTPSAFSALTPSAFSVDGFGVQRVNAFGVQLRTPLDHVITCGHRGLSPVPCWSLLLTMTNTSLKPDRRGWAIAHRGWMIAALAVCAAVVLLFMLVTGYL